MAGNRTQVNCLEGSYAHHYTTIAWRSLSDAEMHICRNPAVSVCRKLRKLTSTGRKGVPLLAGFEPAWGDPNGFLVHRLNHSATTTGKLPGLNNSV